MIPGLSTFLERLQGLLGKAYFVAGFFPVLIVALASALVSWHLRPEARDFFAGIQEDSALDQILAGFALLVLVAILGFIFWTLNTWLRELLEGRYLPRGARDWLEARQQGERERLQRELAGLRPDLARLRRVAGLDPLTAVQEPPPDEAAAEAEVRERQWVNRLRRASEAGEEAGTRAPAAAVAPEVGERFRRLEAARRRGRRIPFAELEAAFAALESELRAKSEARTPGLAERRHQLVDLARYSLARTESAFERLRAQRLFRFPDDATAVGPTALANMARLLRSHAQRCYGMDVDHFWPRVQKIVAGDEHFAAILGESKTKLDFAIAMTWASALFLALWLVVIPLAGGGLGFLAAVVTPAYLSVLVFYLVAVKTYRAFAEALRSAIDLFRFDLLAALHLTLPLTHEDEKALWELLGRHAVEPGVDLGRYEHPKP